MSASNWGPFVAVSDRRDRSIYSARQPFGNGDYRFVVHWDADRDSRVLAVAAALYYREPNIFTEVLAWRESKAHLRVELFSKTVAKLALEKELEHLLVETTYTIDHDQWSYEVVPFDWKDAVNAELERLHHLGMYHGTAEKGMKR